MPTFQTIPLAQLIHSEANVRLTGRTDGIEALAASIAAHGLRQNLNVLPTDDPKRFAVVAGGRRLRALKLLAKRGKIGKSEPIPCRVLDEGDDPAEISLAENTIRAAMHPDDQFEAFRALIEERSLSQEDVAARFGVTPAVVRQRLKLAKVSPKLRALYRKGEMTLEHVMALALSDDHAAQEKAWADLPDWNRDPDTLKAALTDHTIAATDRLARFVGLDAYEAAGGAVLRDLFDDEDAGYLTDPALLQRLAADKMAQAVAEVQEEGWKWVKPELQQDYQTDYRRVFPQGAGDVADDDADAEDFDGEGDGEAVDADETEDAVTLQPAFTAADKARAGVRIFLNPDGTLRIARGYLLPDDWRAELRQNAGSKAEPKEKAGAAALPATMVEELTAHRTAALRVELARHPTMALAATVHALTLATLYHGAERSCLAIRADSEPLNRHTQATADSPAHDALAELGAEWGERLPDQPDDLFGWCLAQPQDVLLALLAYVSALTVDAVEAKYHPAQGRGHADELAQALALDMRQWWTPTTDGFYGKLTKAALAEAVREAKVAPIGVSLTAVKKDEAARLAAKALASSGWLPELLRGTEAVAA